MKKFLSLILFIGCSISLINAQSTVAGGSTRISKNSDNLVFSVGTKVYIVEISQDDAFYSDRSTLVGKRCTISVKDAIPDDAGFYTTELEFENGEKNYFFKVKLSKDSNDVNNIDFSDDQIKKEDEDEEFNMDDFLDELRDLTNHTDNSENIPKGTKVKVLSIGEEDSYFSDSNKYVRKTGVVTDGLTLQTGEYYSGNIKFEDGKEAYFFNVKVQKL